jgi:DNA-binding NtrC family response regulator
MAGAIHILAVDDDNVACDLLREVLEQEGYQVSTATSGQAAIDLAREVPFDLAIIDIRMPDVSGIEVLKALKRANPQMPVLMTTAYSSMNTAIEAIREGAYDYLSKPCKMEELTLTVERALEQSKLLRENQYFRQELREKYKFENIVGTTPAMLAVYKTVARLVDSKATVLIQGESGTGKELIARAIHFNGPRAERPFVAVECASLAESLLESELFGHVRGAFTGAVETKKGLFEIADGGTFFLDEIGDMSSSLQVKVLRVLQEGTFTPVGDTEMRQVDVRIIAATNRDLKAMVARGEFREDLYYRINVIELRVPALRERTADIRVLADAVLARQARELGLPPVRLAPDAVERLEAYAFPGNVRELENILERALTLAEGAVVHAGDIVLRSQSTEPRENGHSLDDDVDQLQRERIVNALERTRWNKTAAAELLGISFRQLRYRLKKLGID